jgi:hypothetical protein
MRGRGTAAAPPTCTSQSRLYLFLTC